MLPEDHPLFYGVCGGVSADAIVLDCFKRRTCSSASGSSRSNRTRSGTTRCRSPRSGLCRSGIASSGRSPRRSATFADILAELVGAGLGPYEWTPDDRARCPDRSRRRSPPEGEAKRPVGLRADASAARALPARHRARHRRRISEDDHVAGVGRVRAALLFRVQRPLGDELQLPGRDGRPVAVPRSARPLHDRRRRIQHDARRNRNAASGSGCTSSPSSTTTAVSSLIDASQQRRNYPTLGVRYGSVDFAAASAGLGAWARRVETMDQLDAAVHEALRVDRPAIIDAVVDPAEYFQDL